MPDIKKLPPELIKKIKVSLGMTGVGLGSAVVYEQSKKTLEDIQYLPQLEKTAMIVPFPTPDAASMTMTKELADHWRHTVINPYLAKKYSKLHGAAHADVGVTIAEMARKISKVPRKDPMSFYSETYTKIKNIASKIKNAKKF